MTMSQRSIVVATFVVGVILLQGPAPDLNPLPDCFFGCEPVSYMR